VREESFEAKVNEEPAAPDANEEPVESTVPDTDDESAEPAEPVNSAGRAADQSAELKRALAELPSLRILFESQSNVLTAESLDILDQIAAVLIRFPETKVAIEGHTDSTGPSDANLELSLLRATTVRDYLIEKGVSVYNLRALGFGEEVPLADNRTAEGRAINRRIDFTF
jgi:outer membrane protein OmpA-like peptidoglycan-associated protein